MVPESIGFALCCTPLIALAVHDMRNGGIESLKEGRQVYGERVQLAKDITDFALEHDWYSVMDDYEGATVDEKANDFYLATLHTLEHEWEAVAWYLTTQMGDPRDEGRLFAAYGLAQRLFALHGIG